LVVGEVVLGAGVAFLLGGAATLLGSGAGSARRRWLLLACAAIWAVVLLPATIYPPLPPGVQSTLSIHQRQGLYLATIAVGLVGFAAALHVLSLKRRFSLPLALAAALVPAALALAFFPDAGANTEALPSRLLTEFRIVSISSELIFWTVMAGVGAFLLRAAERDPRRVRASH
jgi:predicted cobalt transporter CbtA